MKKIDNTKAFEYFLQAAKGGHSGAQFYVGHCYYNGLGINKNIQKAREWLQKAAAQGHSGAIYELRNYDWN